MRVRQFVLILARVFFVAATFMSNSWTLLFYLDTCHCNSRMFCSSVRAVQSALQSPSVEFDPAHVFSWGQGLVIQLMGQYFFFFLPSFFLIVTLGSLSSAWVWTAPCLLSGYFEGSNGFVGRSKLSRPGGKSHYDFCLHACFSLCYLSSSFVNLEVIVRSIIFRCIYFSV